MKQTGNSIFSTLALVVFLGGVTARAIAAGHFENWRHFMTANDGTKAYYYGASVKPIYHPETGRFVGMYVWGGWENPNGTYGKGRYSIFCDTGTYSLDGAVSGTPEGIETASASIRGLPYQPESFVDALAGVVCEWLN